MIGRPLAVAIALVCALAATPAHARHQKHSHHHGSARIQSAETAVSTCDNDGRCIVHSSQQGGVGRTSTHDFAAPPYDGADPRPGAWCMWWLRRELGIPKSAFKPYEYNLARAGRYIGAPASGPAVGVIVVWPHHVGVITARTDAGWVVKSGNDDHAVRERERSIAGAIAFRWPHGQLASR